MCELGTLSLTRPLQRFVRRHNRPVLVATFQRDSPCIFHNWNVGPKLFSASCQLARRPQCIVVSKAKPSSAERHRKCELLRAFELNHGVLGALRQADLHNIRGCAAREFCIEVFVRPLALCTFANPEFMNVKAFQSQYAVVGQDNLLNKALCRNTCSGVFASIYANR